MFTMAFVCRVQLEDLSRQMHDEVSETENIRLEPRFKRRNLNFVLLRKYPWMCAGKTWPLSG